MNRKALGLSGLLLLGLIAVSVLLNRDVIQGVVNDADLDYSVAQDRFGLGETVVATGTIAFANGEIAHIFRVRLVNETGPQAFDAILPVLDTGGQFLNIPDQVAGDLSVRVTFENVIPLSGTLPGTLPSTLPSTLPGTLPSTLPGTNLPGGGNFQGVAAGARMVFDVKWIPPVFLDPAPVFTLIPETDVRFPIPQLAGPATTSGRVLPETDLKFSIPSVGAPAGTALPAADTVFNIPQVTVDTNATTAVPNLPSTTDSSTEGGFLIPDLEALGLVEANPDGVPDFPLAVADFTIPDLDALGLLPSVSGVSNSPTAGVAFSPAGAPAVRGLATDGTDFFFISDNTGPGAVDQIVKVNATGTVDTTFATSSTPGFLDAPSGAFEAIVFLNSHLWIVENLFRCGDILDPAGICADHRIFKIDPTATPDSSLEEDWATSGAAVAIFSTNDTFARYGGITAEGAGAAGTLWLAHVDGFKFDNVSQSGSSLSSPFTDFFVPRFDSVAFSANTLYTSDGNQVTQWNKQGQFQRQVNIVDGGASPVAGIRGMTFKTISSQPVLHMGSSDGSVYSTFFAPSATNDPRGIANTPSTAAVGQALWILVDGEPNDKLLKVSTTTGLLISTFGTNGFVDAPSNRTEGITFLSGSLWIIANEDGVAKLFKVRASDGVLQSTFDLGATANIFDDLGGIATDGTNLIVHTKSFFNQTFVLNTSGQRTGLGEAFPFPSFNGASGLAFNAARQQFFAAKNSSIAVYDTNFNLVREVGLSQGGAPVNNIEGASFDGNTFYVARRGSGFVSKSFLATNVLTVPKGIAFTPAASTPGKALWILVDGDPRDKLLKVDPDDGTLISGFGSSGAVDTPSDRTEGVTFLNTGVPSTSFLWVVANTGSFDPPRLYKINASTGALVQEFNLGNTANLNDDVGGITNDGTNLVLFAKSFNDIVKIDTSGQRVDASFINANTFGARGLAHHSVRGQFFAVRGSNLITIDSAFQTLREQTLIVDAAVLSGDTEGVTFDQDVFYVARNEGGVGKVSVGALRVTVTTDPLGLAFSPAGSSLLGSPIGRALWALVDGSPKDKILKLDPDATTTADALITAFGTNGAVDAPGDSTSGITFLDGFLWIISNEGFDQQLFKVSGTTGALVQTFNLSGGPGGFLFDQVGGISNDGTNLLLFPTNFIDLIVVDTTGQQVERRGTGQLPQINGARSAAFRSGQDQLLAAKNSNIAQFDVGGGRFDLIDEFVTTLTGIQGMTFDVASSTDPSDDVLYVAHSGSGVISKTGIPSDITNNPRGLAYDASADELYILVDGKGLDHIVVVDPTTGAVIRDFEAPDDDTDAITFLNGDLYVAIRDEDFCCPPPSVSKLSTTTGTVLDSFELNFLFDRVTGLSNDGTDLIALPEFGGPEAVFVDPDSGSQGSRVFFFDPFGPVPDGMQAMAFRVDEEEFFPVNGETVFRFDGDGRKLEEFTVTTGGFGNVRGSVFVGDLLYMAEGQGKTIHSSGIPAPDTVITTNPRAMTTDGTDLYVVVDASPRDKLLKIATATGLLIDTFGTAGAADSPGTETDGAAFHNGFLYVVTNDERTIIDPFGGFFVEVLPTISKLDPNTGEELQRFEILVDDPFNPFSPPLKLFDTIGGLGSDGAFLYAGVKGTEGGQGRWFKIDPQNPFAPAEEISEFQGRFPFMPGFQSMELTIGDEFSEDRELLASGSIDGSGIANVIARFDKDSGVMFNQFQLASTTNVKGMGAIGTTFFLADDAPDGGVDNILTTSLPENTGVELTIVGNYESELSVEAVSDDGAELLITRSPLTPWRIGKNRAPLLRLTSPFQDFVATTTTTTIAGLVDDPSIAQVNVGVQLPFFVLLEDTSIPGVSRTLWDVDSDGGAAEWHVTCTNEFPPTVSISAPCSWRYGVQDQPGFETGQRTQGSLTTVDIVNVSSGMGMQFFSAYDTELGPERDQKLVEVAIVTTDLQGNDVVGEFQPVLQIVSRGFGGENPPANAHPSFRFVEHDPIFINPNMIFERLDLTPFAGQRIIIRFRFDSVDRFANFGLGWFVDDIVIAGSGTRTVTVPTTRLDPPVVSDGVRFHTSFSQDFELAEGENVVLASGVQPYGPFLVAQDQVSGFLDTTFPVVSLFGIDANTNQLAQTLLGTIDDDTLVSLIVTQITAGASSTIFSLSSVPESGSFQVPVSLADGTNTFEAVALDGGNLESTAVFVVVADVAAPVVADDGAIFPIGAVSARTLDEVIFQVTADDGAGSGVEKVELLDSNGQVVAELLTADEIPQIIRDEFNITGNFVLFSSVLEGIPPGRIEVTLRATDLAGNEADTLIAATVTASLEAQNIFLFDGANLVGINLLDKSGASAPSFDVEDVLAQKLDTTFLDANFVQDVIGPGLAATTAATPTPISVGVASTSVAVADSSGFDVGDRVSIGSGETRLRASTGPGTTVLPVAGTAGFSVGQTIVVGSGRGAFELGFADDAEATSITNIDASNNEITVDPLSGNHFPNDLVAGIEQGRVISTSAGTITVAGRLLVAPLAGFDVVEEPKLGDVIDAIFFFTGGESVGVGGNQGVFQSYIPGPAFDTLTQMQQGRGYWFITDSAAFARSTPLIAGSAGPIIPITMQIDGVLFDPTGSPPSLPATVNITKTGWHQLALIGERNRSVERGLRGLITTEGQKFTSVLEFQKFISFDPDTGNVTVVGGVFNPLFVGSIEFPGDTMEIGRGFYVRVSVAGEHTP